MVKINKENAIYGFQDEYRFLSNFDPTPLVYGGLQIKTAEHLYNALKTNSLEEALHVLDAPTPGQAKTRGRKVTLKDDWETVKYDAMRTSIGVKFIGNLSLASKLVETGDKELIEANYWHDQIWGDCYCGVEPKCEPEGQNALGRLLMELRRDLRNWIK